MVNLRPNGDRPTLSLTSHYPIGAATAWQALDSSTASYLVQFEYDITTVDLDDSTIGAAEYALVRVQFDVAIPTQGGTASQVQGTLYPLHGAFAGSPVADAFGSAVSASFTGATVRNAMILSKDALDTAVLQFVHNGSFADNTYVNDAYVEILDTYTGPTTTVLGPSGVIADSTPTVSWSATLDDAASGETEYGWRMRIFNSAQYGAGGFDPGTSACLFESGIRATATYGHSFTTPPLPPDTYRAYVSTIQNILPPGYTISSNPFPFGAPQLFAPVYQFGAYAFTQFIVIAALPATTGPTILPDTVRDLTEAQKLFLTEPHRPVIRTTLFLADGSEVGDLAVTDGTVTLDAANQVRGKVTFTCANPELVPASRLDALNSATPLHPFGSYVQVVRGIVFDRFGSVYVQIGVFRLDKVKRNRITGAVTCTGSDFSGHLLDACFGAPISRQDWSTIPPTPDLITTAAADIISEAGLASRIPTASALRVAINYVNEKGKKRTDALDFLATSIAGWVCFADIDGVILFGPGPDFANDPVAYTFDDRSEFTRTFTATNSEAELDRTKVYDTVVAADQADIFLGGAYDANADSPIHRHAANPASLAAGAGPFAPGGKPFFYSSPVVTDQTTANTAARTRLGNVALPAETITVTGPPLPDLRPGKIILMARPNDIVIARWVVTRVSLPLSEDDAMSFEAAIPTSDVVPAN